MQKLLYVVVDMLSTRCCDALGDGEIEKFHNSRGECSNAMQCDDEGYQFYEQKTTTSNWNWSFQLLLADICDL